MNTMRIGSMCRKNKVNCKFIKLVTLLGFSGTKLAILSTAKHLKYSINIPILGMELERHTESITNVQFSSNFLRMSPNQYL